MIPDSAFITVGEPAATVAAAAAGRAPGAEYAVLRSKHFTKVVAQVDGSSDLSSTVGGARFAAAAYASTWDCRNIYLGEEFPGIQYLAVQALLRRRKQIAMLIHNTSSLRRRLPLATLRLGQLTSHLLCLSQHSRRELESRYNIEPSRITVVGSRVDTQFFAPNKAIKGELQICSAGAVNRDYATLIDAVAPLGIPLKIAADTAWRYSASEQTAQPAPGFVEMRSWGSYEKLRDLYAASAVVVVPLAKPMLSGITVALEAMAMGKPVILSHNEYVEDFVIDGENCLLVAPGRPDLLREKIRYLLDRPEEAARLGARARDWVLDRYTVSKYVNRILSVWN